MPQRPPSVPGVPGGDPGGGPGGAGKSQLPPMQAVPFGHSESALQWFSSQCPPNGSGTHFNVGSGQSVEKRPHLWAMEFDVAKNERTIATLIPNARRVIHVIWSSLVAVQSITHPRRDRRATLSLEGAVYEMAPLPLLWQVVLLTALASSPNQERCVVVGRGNAHSHRRADDDRPLLQVQSQLPRRRPVGLDPDTMSLMARASLACAFLLRPRSGTGPAPARRTH
jgi:hypothetical protein